MDDVINLDTLRAEVDRKGSLLSETWTDLYSLLTKYQAQLHVKYDGIRGHVVNAETNDQNGGESQELHAAKQEIHRKESILSKYQIDLIKTTDTLERVKHELRLCQAKLDQVSELNHRQEEEVQRLKSSAEKREETICQLKRMVYAKETELVHKSRLLANTAGMYDGAVAKSLQLSSENNLLRDELDRQRQLHEDFLKHCTCNPSKRRRKVTSPSPMSAPVSNCTSPVNDRPSPPTPNPLTPVTPSPTTPSQPRELNRSHSLESRGELREQTEDCMRNPAESRSSNPSPITTITALSRQGSIKHRRPASITEYRTEYRIPYTQDYQKCQPSTPNYCRSALPSPTSSQHVVIPVTTPVHTNRPILSQPPLRSSTPTSESGPAHTPILASTLNMGGTLGKARKAMAALAKSESREEKEEEKSPPQEVNSPVEAIPTTPMLMVYEHYRPASQLSAIPILHKPAPIFGILPAGTTLAAGTTLTAGTPLSAAPSLAHPNCLINTSMSSGVGSMSCGSSAGGGVIGSNSLCCSNSSNSSNSSLEADEAREEQKVMMHNGSHILARLPQTGKTERPRKRCRVCYRSGRRKETPYHCAHCPGKPGLCANPCFQDYHGKIASGEWKDMLETSKELNSPIASPNDMDDDRSQPIFPKVEEEEKPRSSDIVPDWLRASNSTSAIASNSTSAVAEPCDMSLSKKD